MGLWGEDNNFGILDGLDSGDESCDVLRRLAGEKLTVAAIFGGGVGGFVCDFEVDVEEGSGGFDFGAKKREMTCCFCFPIVGDGNGVSRR